MDLKEKKYILIFIIGSLMSMLSSGIFQIGILLYIWPSMLLFSFRRIKNHKLFSIYFGIYTFFMIFKYYNLSGGYIWLDIIGYIGFSLLEFIPLLIDYYTYDTVKKKNGYLACFIYPLSYIVLSYLISLIYPTIELTASLAHYLFVSQVVSLFGTNFLTLLVLLFNTTLLYIAKRIENKEKILKPIIISLFVISIVLIYGGLVTFKKVDSFDVKIASILGSDLGDFYKDSYINSDLSVDKEFLEEKVKEAKMLNCDLVISAEESAELLFGEEEEYKKFVSDLAKDNNIPILIGVDVYLDEAGDYRKDCLYFFDEKGTFKREYVKHTLLPYEDLYYLRGKTEPFYVEIKLKDSNILRITSTICYDINNAKYIASLNKDTNLLVNQSWVWDEIDKQQQNIQLLRTLELGTSFLSSTIDATSTIYSYNGIKMDECYRYIENRRDLKLFKLEVPKNRKETLYSFIYMYIEYIYLLFFLVLIVCYFKERKKA